MHRFERGVVDDGPLVVDQGFERCRSVESPTGAGVVWERRWRDREKRRGGVVPSEGRGIQVSHGTKEPQRLSRRRDRGVTSGLNRRRLADPDPDGWTGTTRHRQDWRTMRPGRMTRLPRRPDGANTASQFTAQAAVPRRHEPNFWFSRTATHKSVPNGASHLTRSAPAFAQRATAWPLNPDGEDEARRAPPRNSACVVAGRLRPAPGSAPRLQVSCRKGRAQRVWTLLAQTAARRSCIRK